MKKFKSFVIEVILCPWRVKSTFKQKQNELKSFVPKKLLDSVIMYSWFFR